MIDSIATCICAGKMLLDTISEARRYFDCEPFTVRVDNYDASLVYLNAYVLDDKKKASNAIIPEFFIKKNSTSASIFCANRISKS